MTDVLRPERAPRRVVVDRWICPWCSGAGRYRDGPAQPAGTGERCYDCAGTGLTSTRPSPDAWAPEEILCSPRPPALMKSPCNDCAFRPDSPETESGDHTAGRISPDIPFWCHKGMHNAAGERWVPTAWVGDIPLGAMLCRGWWDVHVEDLPGPTEPCRGPDAS